MHQAILVQIRQPLGKGLACAPAVIVHHSAVQCILGWGSTIAVAATALALGFVSHVERDDVAHAAAHQCNGLPLNESLLRGCGHPIPDLGDTPAVAGGLHTGRPKVVSKALTALSVGVPSLPKNLCAARVVHAEIMKCMLLALLLWIIGHRQGSSGDKALAGGLDVSSAGQAYQSADAAAVEEQSKHITPAGSTHHVSNLAAADDL
mmetsp:Transcript_23719/g.52058  ORF Transcript_23719/g.52058 Transcript_23719/m.52058 type:complete len:206 (-) Transcript_23719:211-828(-)